MGSALATRGTNGTSATPKERLAEGERILERFNQGAKVSQLMEEFGYSHATIYRRLDEAIKSRIAPNVDQYREAQNALLDDLAARWQRQLEAAVVMVEEGTKREEMTLLDRGMTRHAEALVGIQRVAERRARLMGLDAPVKVDAKVTVTTPVDDAVAALVAEVEGAAS